MGIGFSIFLLALGAILRFALDATVSGINIQFVGVILMGAGVLGLILAMFVFTPRRHRSVTATHTVQGVPTAAAPERVTDQEVRTDGM